MTDSERESRQWPSLHGGRLSADFVNTVDPRTGEDDHDALDTYRDLLGWCQHADVIDAAEHRALERLARADQARADAAFADAITFREALYRVLAALASDAPPPPADLEALNRVIGPALAAVRLAVRDGEVVEEWADDTLEAPLWRIARDARDLLASPARHRVRQCHADTCGWVFVDASRAGRRKWCSMEGCGNRAKARRFATRQRAGARPTGARA